MRWLPRRPKPSPKRATFETYRFRPLPDMTAQELAMLLTLANPLHETVLVPEPKFDITEPPAVLFERELGMPEIGRHFEPTGFTKDYTL